MQAGQLSELLVLILLGGIPGQPLTSNVSVISPVSTRTVVVAYVRPKESCIKLVERMGRKMDCKRVAKEMGRATFGIFHPNRPLKWGVMLHPGEAVVLYEGNDGRPHLQSYPFKGKKY